MVYSRLPSMWLKKKFYKAKQKIMCVSCFIMKNIRVGKSDLTFYNFYLF